MRTPSKVIILLGPPGSGKGTQALRLSRELGIPAISTGEMLRSESQSGSDLGRAVKQFVDFGQLVSDTVMNQVVSARLRRLDCDDGCILDGYPRTVSQARFLDSLLDTLSATQSIVFDFEISAEEIISRVSRRRQCPRCGTIFSVDAAQCGELFCDRDGSLLAKRADDTPKTVAERLRLYSQNATDLVRYYEKRAYRRISASRPPEQVSEDLLKHTSPRWIGPNLVERAHMSA